MVAFAYNRADKIIKCLESLEKNPEAALTDLYVFSDGPKDGKGKEAVENTRKALHEYEKRSSFAKVKIVEAPKNKGLAASIIDGVTAVLAEHGRAVIVEDDLIVSKRFLSYMNDALDFYEKNPRVGAVSGYTYPMKCLDSYDKDVYLMHKGDCWGWATWADKWNSAKWADTDFDAYFRNRRLRRDFENTENGWDLLMLLQSRGKISSWAVRWVLNLFQNDLWTVYPRRSLVTNNGFDGSGTHSNRSEEEHFFARLEEGEGEFKFEDLKPDKTIERQAAVYPRKGVKAGAKYYLKRVYVRLYDVKRAITGK